MAVLYLQQFRIFAFRARGPDLDQVLHQPNLFWAHYLETTVELELTILPVTSSQRTVKPIVQASKNYTKLLD